MAPAKEDHGLQVPGHHSWGGHVVRDDVGLYHGFFSFMLGHCTLSEWKTNSAIIHAVADAPEGPFTPRGQSVYDPVPGVVVQPWAHSAFITYDTAHGEWLLYHIGSANTSSSEWKECNESGRSRYLAAFEECSGVGEDCSVGQEHKQSLTFYVHTSKSLHGPWKAPPGPLPLTNETFYQSWWSNPPKKNNPSMPAPLILENGTVLLYYQANPCPADWDTLAPTCVGLMRADHWKGPYEQVGAAPLVRPENEDPFVFKTARGYHMLTNVNTYHRRCKLGEPCGGHAWSRDGVEWSDLDMAAFGPIITFENGSSIRNSYVERPQVFLENDVPRVLYLGLSRPDGYSDSITWAQAFCAAGQANCSSTIAVSTQFQAESVIDMV